jgi:hypothetical protein
MAEHKFRVDQRATLAINVINRIAARGSHIVTKQLPEREVSSNIVSRASPNLTSALHVKASLLANNAPTHSSSIARSEATASACAGSGHVSTRPRTAFTSSFFMSDVVPYRPLSARHAARRAVRHLPKSMRILQCPDCRGREGNRSDVRFITQHLFSAQNRARASPHSIACPGAKPPSSACVNEISLAFDVYRRRLNCVGILSQR